MTGTTITEPTTSDLPEGVHASDGVEYLARAAGLVGDLPKICIFGEEMGFSETTAFIKTSRGNGYYQTTLKTCTCPSFKFRGRPCKHQKILSERLERRARIDERNRQRDEERARDPKPSTSQRGFNQPETLAVAPL